MVNGLDFSELEVSQSLTMRPVPQSAVIILQNKLIIGPVCRLLVEVCNSDGTAIVELKNKVQPFTTEGRYIIRTISEDHHTGRLHYNGCFGNRQ